MKRLLLVALTFLCFTSLRAQGLLGLGTTDLAKKKIESIELVLTGSEKLSPSSTFQLGLIARDKKGREFKTYGMDGGKYPFETNYDIAIENAVLNDFGTVTVNPVNLLKTNQIKISIKFKSNPSLNTEKVVPINYDGKIVASFRGRDGRHATVGMNGMGYTNKNPNGLRGQNAGENAEDGEPGKKVEAYAWVEKINDTDMLRVVIKETRSGEISYYQTRAASANLIIDANGGHGGWGANGGSGGSGSKELGGSGGNGGNGSNGADGGSGGSIVLSVNENAKDYMQAIVLTNDGGRGGSKGYGGSGGYGASKGTQGLDGSTGRQGAAGPAPVKTIQTSDLKWFE